MSTPFPSLSPSPSLGPVVQQEKGRLEKEAVDNMEELARLTKNFSGAEIEGLVKSAASYAFTRGIDVKNLGKAPDPKNLVVQWKVQSMYYRAIP